MKGVGGGVRALAMALALGTRGFSGAQAFARTADVAPPINFDPFKGSWFGGKDRKSKPGKRRRGGSSDKGCGAKQCAKYKRNPLSRNYHADRMAWLERNAHVIAKREADQERARGPLGGLNAIRWGRR